MISGLKPINLLPARERVASALRKAIISGHFQAGQTVTLDSLASDLGVSVTPVREAMQILARDGLVELKTNKGAVIRGIDESILVDHYQVRAVLEAEACRLCCVNNADLNAIENVLLQAEEALKNNNSSDYGNYNQSFHYEIWLACGNVKLKNMLSELWNGLSMGIRSTLSGYAVTSLEEHKKIFEALKERDGEKASEHMHQHIMNSLESMLTNITEK